MSAILQQYFYTVKPGDTGLIAYVSSINDTYDIWVYNPRNGVQVRLTEGLADYFSVPYWSPDSSYIAFVGKDRIVYVLHLPSGEIAQIDQLIEGEIHTLDWSPDSQSLVYTKLNQMILYNVVSHRAQRIIEPGATDVQWFPNGTEFLYQAPDANGISQLFRIRVDGTGKQQVTNNQQGRLNYVRLTPNGRFALYTTPGVSISIIHTVDLTTGEVFVVRGGPEAKNYFPTWSPDSSKIAYSATAFSERGYFSLVRTTGNRGENDRTWNISDCFATPVSWSPDSRKIVYLSGCHGQAFASEMWYFNLNHPVPIQLVRRGMITSVSWSPTSKNSLPRRTYENPLYRVRFQYPMNWTEVSPERYEGVDGFFQISALSAGPNIRQVCLDEAFHPLMPYGTQPRLFHTNIQNQEACFIFPSFDQPPEMRGQAALIVRYPKPIQIDDETYNYFILWASNQYIYSLASTLMLLACYE
ncbi:TolB family protein [Alkalihalobacterium alkalinitrilicum]|uniref:TolB family protein n=1 Tax=Alkalihalobacterium alkalinitrilicum TaxID=427920 RepID=UPI001EE3A7F6|nr:hypothetical protein [Alkalihalobacterium alkalinitrilicum]